MKESLPTIIKQCRTRVISVETAKDKIIGNFAEQPNERVVAFKLTHFPEYTSDDKVIELITSLITDIRFKQSALTLSGDVDGQNYGVSDEHVIKLIDALLENRTIKSLNLTELNLNVSAATKLANYLQCSDCTLTHLDLASCDIGRDAANALASSIQKSNCSLKALKLGSMDIVGGIAIHVALMTPGCPINTLTICSAIRTPHHMKPVAGLIAYRKSALTHLGLASCPINDICEPLLQSLILPGCSLISLSLDDCKLSDETGQKLLTILKDPRCPVLAVDTRHNNFDDATEASLQETCIDKRRSLGLSLFYLAAVCWNNRLPLDVTKFILRLAAPARTNLKQLHDITCQQVYSEDKAGPLFIGVNPAN